MNNLEQLPGRKDNLSEFQRKYNMASKSFVSMVGANISLFICILLPILLIGFIWTDFGIPEVGLSLVSDGIVTVALFIIGETMMMSVGADGGKLDSEYLKAKKVFAELVESVNKTGTMLMSVFCEWQIDLELKQAVNSRLKALRLTSEDWENIKEMSSADVKQRYGRKKARQIFAINRLEPIELNETILMFEDTNEAFTRGGVPISGEGYMKKKSHSVGKIFGIIFTCLLTVSVAISLTSDISFSRVMYTAFKLVVLLFRMAKGYATGAKAYNTVEVKQLQAKASFLRQYERFVNEKIYLNLGDKYGDITAILSKSEVKI